MGRYVAVDFETANEQRGSACALAVLTVEDGAIVDRWSTLIDPETDFSGMNIAIHGIRPDDVRGAPTFPNVAERLADYVADAEVVVAHSAAFDVQVLRSSAARYGVRFPAHTFACTRVFARHWFPGWPSYALMYCVQQLDLIETLGGNNHHDPTWDAEAAALIAETGLRRTECRTWEEAARACQVRLGAIDITANYQGCVTSSSSVQRIAPEPRPGVEFDPDHPFYGATLTFTGALALYTRRQAAQLVVDRGGHFAPNVKRETDYLVVGEQDVARLAGHAASAKMRKATGMAADGHHIEVIDEIDFYKML
jgi:DNA polymerase III subunit epsilon